VNCFTRLSILIKPGIKLIDSPKPRKMKETRAGLALLFLQMIHIEAMASVSRA